MADECTDIMAVEVLSVFCHWEEDDSVILFEPLKKADAAVKCIKDKHLQVCNIVGMGVDGAAIFSGKETDWCSSKTKETCSTCSVCPLPLSPPAITLHVSCQ